MVFDVTCSIETCCRPKHSYLKDAENLESGFEILLCCKVPQKSSSSCLNRPRSSSANC